MKIRIFVALFCAMLMLAVALVPGIVSATSFDALNSQTCSTVPGAAKSSTCKQLTEADKTNPIAGGGGLLGRVVTVLAFVAGILTVFAVVAAGFQYLTSNGDASKITSARRTLTYAIIGLIVTFFSAALVQFVLDRAT